MRVARSALKARGCLPVLQSRHFQPRAAKNTWPPPYTEKTNFDYSNVQPVAEDKKAADINDVWVKQDVLFDHYTQMCNWRDNHFPGGGLLAYVPNYGRYWTAHLGFNHWFIKQRN